MPKRQMEIVLYLNISWVKIRDPVGPEKEKAILNKFALLVILMIAIPEIIDRRYFEGQKHHAHST